MKRLILLLAIAGAAYGAWHSYQTRNDYIQAALLSEAFNLTAPVKLRVADYFLREGVMPHDNASAALPPARSIYGTSVKRIALQRGGVLRVDFAEVIGERSMLFLPTVSPVSGLLRWRCHSDSIEPAVLEKLRPSCEYLPATLESDLMNAIANSQRQRVSELLAAGASPGALINGNTPLMLAAKIGDTRIVEQLLDAGARIDNAAIGAERRTPLIIAITSNRPRVVSLLLSRGASVNVMDYRGMTPYDHAVATDERLGGQRFTLMVAARYNPKFAGAPGPDIPPGNTRIAGRMPETLYEELRRAALDCHVHRLGSLLRQHQDLDAGELIEGRPLANHVDKPQCSARLTAFLSGKQTFAAAREVRFRAVVSRCDVREAESLLRAHKDIDVLRAAEQPSHFVRALEAGCADLVDLMIRERELEDKLPATLLSAAIRSAPQTSVVRVVGSLLAAGAEVNTPGEDGQAPLAAAIALEQPVAAKYLVDAGADVDAKTANNSYPLIEATKKGYTHLVRQMLARGAEVDRRDALGRTALLVAVARGRQRLVDLLLRAGADRRIRDTNGVDALVLAESRNYKQIKTMLASGAVH